MSENRGVRSWLRPRVLVGLVVTVAALVFVGSKVSFGEVAQTVGRADPGFLLAACAANVALLAIRALKWTLLVRSQLPGFTHREGWRTYLGGLTISIVTPAGAGEMARGLLIGSDDRVAELTSLAVFDKVANLFCVVLFGIAGAWLHLSDSEWMTAGLAAGALAAVAGLVALRRLGAPAWLPGAIRRGAAALRELPTARLLVVLGLSALAFCFYFAQAWFLLQACNDGPVGMDAVAMWPVVTLSALVPSLLSGLGPREVTAAMLLPAAGVVAEAATAASLLQFLLIAILPGLLGIPGLLLRGKSGECSAE